MNEKYSKLMESFTFKNGVTLRNRVVMAPMTTWASNDDYTISDEELNYYKKSDRCRDGHHRLHTRTAERDWFRE